MTHRGSFWLSPTGSSRILWNLLKSVEIILLLNGQASRSFSVPSPSKSSSQRSPMPFLSLSCWSWFWKWFEVVSSELHKLDDLPVWMDNYLSRWRFHRYQCRSHTCHLVRHLTKYFSDKNTTFKSNIKPSVSTWSAFAMSGQLSRLSWIPSKSRSILLSHASPTKSLKMIKRLLLGKLKVQVILVGIVLLHVRSVRTVIANISNSIEVNVHLISVGDQSAIVLLIWYSVVVDVLQCNRRFVRSRNCFSSELTSSQASPNPSLSVSIWAPLNTCGQLSEKNCSQSLINSWNSSSHRKHRRLDLVLPHQYQLDQDYRCKRNYLGDSGLHRCQCQDRRHLRFHLDLCPLGRNSENAKQSLKLFQQLFIVFH